MGVRLMLVEGKERWGLVVWHGISVTYLWGPLCGGREGGVFVGGDALE